jgi:hypothetical protein
MIQHGLSKHPEAQKWKKVEALVMEAEPTLREIDGRRFGPAWKLARSKFDKEKANEASEEAKKAKPKLIEAEQVHQEAKTFVLPTPGQANTPQALMFTFNMGDMLSKAEAERRKSEGIGSKMLPDGSKLEAEKANRRRGEAAKRKNAIHTVKICLNELLDGSKSYLQLCNAIASYGGVEATEVLKEATGIILDMQSHFMSAKLIKNKLKSRYGDQFEKLIEAIWKLSISKNGQIVMPKGWEKLPLPVDLNTNSGNPAENPCKMGHSSHHLLPLQLQLTYLLLQVCFLLLPLQLQLAPLLLQLMLLRLVNCLKTGS